VHEHARLARAGAGEHEQRALGALDGLALLGIESFEDRLGEHEGAERSGAASRSEAARAAIVRGVSARSRLSRAAPLAALVFLIAVAAYLPGLRNGFVDWDDNAFVTENPMLASGLSVDTVRRAFGPYESNWIPLTWLSLAADHALFGFAPAGYHAVNALWHAATAALLLLALARSTGALAPAALVALCFALHPLRVESVAWVTERKDVLSGFWFVAAIACWLAYGRRPSAARYLGAVGAAALSLLAKSTAVTLPFVLLLLDGWPLDRLGNRAARRRAVAEKLPFLAMSAAIAVITFRVQRGGGAFASLEYVPLDARAGNAVLSYIWYLGKAFWPTGLAAFYPHSRAVPDANSLGLGVFVLLGVTLAVLAAARARPWLCVGWLWFLGMLVPMIGLVQVGEQARADRYAYLPQVGLEIAVAFELWALLGARRGGRAVFAAVTAAAALALGVAQHAQLATWRNTGTLFTHAIAVTDANYLALERVGQVQLVAGDLDGATDSFSASLRIRPNWADARSGLAQALWRRGRRDEAIWNFREAARLKPTDGKQYDQLARAFGDMGWHDEAILVLRAGLRSATSGAPMLHYLLAVELARRGDTAAARDQAERAVSADPGIREAQLLLGRLRLDSNDAPGAERVLRAALAANGDDPDLRSQLANTLMRQGRDAEAVTELRAVLASHSDAPAAENDLAWILATSRDAAVRDPVEALRLAEAATAATGRSNADVLDTLAAAQAANGRFDDALATLDAALALLRPGSDAAAAIDARRARFAARQPWIGAVP
jgi:tetratricopeptide (TPR) repeat protein